MFLSITCWGKNFHLEQERAFIFHQKGRGPRQHWHSSVWVYRVVGWQGNESASTVNWARLRRLSAPLACKCETLTGLFLPVVCVSVLPFSKDFPGCFLHLYTFFLPYQSQTRLHRVSFCLAWKTSRDRGCMTSAQSILMLDYPNVEEVFLCHTIICTFPPD